MMRANRCRDLPDQHTRAHAGCLARDVSMNELP
jgi:hypothetical protein